MSGAGPTPVQATERLTDEASTRALAARIGAALAPGDVLALTGPLGAGKTTLVRALVAALGGDPAAVVSPTFVLLQQYAGRVPLAHVDAYRLTGPEDLRALGWDEVYPPAGATAIEWADRVAAVIPPGAVWLALQPGDGGTRVVTASGPRGSLRRFGFAT